MKLNLGCGKYLLDGFDNLDIEDFNWNYKLPFKDSSVEAITISHTLMYSDNLDFSLKELYRILKQDGVCRITEDETKEITSSRFGGYFDAVTLTSKHDMAVAMTLAGFKVKNVNSKTTNYKDNSLLQDFHGGSPKVFFIEGIK